MLTSSICIFIVTMVTKHVLEFTHPTCAWVKTPSSIKCKKLRWILTILGYATAHINPVVAKSIKWILKDKY